MPPLSPSPDTGRRERKRRQTLDHLADTAFHLFDRHGYDGVTMEQIAATADVAKGTLYNHFPVKEALLAHRFHRDLAAGAPQLRLEMEGLPDFPTRLRHLLHAMAAWAEPRRVYLSRYLQYRLAGHGGGAGSSGLDRIFDALVRAGQDSGEVRRDLSAGHLAHMLRLLHLGALMRWLERPDADLRAEFEALITVFLDGAATP